MQDIIGQCHQKLGSVLLNVFNFFFYFHLLLDAMILTGLGGRNVYAVLRISLEF